MPNVIEITVKVRDQATAETAAIAEKIRADMAAAAGSSGAGIQVPVEADTSKLERDIEQKIESASKTDPIEVPVEADDSSLEGDVRAKVKHVRPDAVKVPVEADASGLDEKVKAETKRVKPDSVKVSVEADAEDFETQFRAAMEEGQKVSDNADRAMRGSFTSMESGSRTLRAAMADLQPAAEQAGSAVEDAGNKSDDAGKKAANSGAGFSLAALKMTGMITAALALAPALAALPAAGAAITVGMGTMSLGLGGVISALKDYGAQSASSGQSGAQLAQTAFSNAIAIRNAEQAIADAKKQAARAAQSSADQIYSAQERVAQAAYGAQQAQQSLTDAQQSATQAQKALTQAYADATNQLVDLNNAAADSSIAVEQAELRLTEARQNLAQVTGSSMSTDDQKRQAQIDLMAATQGLKDAQQKQIESQQAADAANKTGVDGMQAVVSAQNAVQKANEGVANAQHGVASATQAQTDAQTALARAVQASAQQQADSAEAIAKAEQNLSDTYEQQKLAAAAAASSGSAAADKFAQDMAKLTPAGRDFVNQLISMKGGLHDLEATAQTSMLPGFTTLLKNVAGPNGLGPLFNKSVGDMGTIIGNTAVQFGNLMTTPAFKGQLTQVLKDGAGFAKNLADGLVGLTGGLAQAAAQAGPIVSGLGSGIKTLMTSGIPAFFQGLVSNAGGAGSAIQGIATIVSNLAGPLGTVAGGLSAALAPALQVLASPEVSQSLQSIAASIAQILIVLAPVVAMLAQGLAGALRIAAPLLQSVAKFMQDNATWAVPLAKGVAAATLAFVAFNAVLAANPIVLLVSAITGLVLGLIYAWEHFKGFRDFMQGMWRDIKAGFDFFLGFVKQWWPELLAPFTGGISLIIGHWNDIVDFTKKLPGRLASAADHIWDWVTQTWDKYVAGPVGRNFDSFVTTVSGLPGRLAGVGGHMWDWIRDAFKTAINTVIGWWDSLSFGIPTVHIPGTDINVGGGSIGVPQIPYFAKGGALPSGLTAAIGDGGWEPLRMPDGSIVIPHANARQAIADGALGAGGSDHARLEWVGPEGDELFTLIKRWIRVRYGTDPNSVQKAFGQSF